jgi:small subunit ribosomal protein S6
MSKTKASGPGHYEILFIIANEYTEKEAKKISQAVEDIISKYKSEINYREFWGKKKLAYPIKHNHFGYYSLLEFDLETQNLPKLNENLRLFDKIIRFQIIKRRKRTLEEINTEKTKQEVLSKDKEEKNTKKEKREKEDLSENKNKDDSIKEKEEKKIEEKKETTKDTKKEEEKKKKEKEDNLKDLNDKLDNILDSQDLIK